MNPRMVFFLFHLLREQEIQPEVVSRVITQLINSAVCVSALDHQIFKRIAEKPVRKNAADYFINRRYEDFEAFLKNACQMAAKKAGKHPIIQTWKRGLNAEIYGTEDYILEAFNFFDEVMGDNWHRHIMTFKFIEKNSDPQKNLSVLFPTPASRYLPAPYPGWDDYVYEAFTAETKVMALKLTLLKSDELPFEILGEIKEKYKDEWSINEISMGVDEEDDKKGLSREVYEKDDRFYKGAEMEKPVAEDDQDGIPVEHSDHKPTPWKLIDEVISKQPKKRQNRIHKIKSVLADAKREKIKIGEIAKQTGESVRTLRDDFAKIRQDYKEELKETPVEDRSLTAPLKSQITDRTMTCPNCKLVLPPKSRKLKCCPFCIDVPLERYKKP
jgi:hypothetical protein